MAIHKKKSARIVEHEGSVEYSEWFTVSLIGNADDHPVRTHKIIDGIAFLQKLGVRGDSYMKIQRFGKVLSKMQPVVGDVTVYEALQARLKNRRFAFFQHFDFAFVDVYTDDIMTNFSQTSPAYQTDVSCSHHDDAHHCLLYF